MNDKIIVPKLLFKKRAEDFLKRDKENNLTEEDFNDYIELLQSFTDFLNINHTNKDVDYTENSSLPSLNPTSLTTGSQSIDSSGNLK